MRFLITGTPRSATQYAARLFSALGVPCSHEGTLRPKTEIVDVLRWYRAECGGESSWMAWTLQSLFPAPVPMLHTIRDPWKVIDSLANRNAILKTDENSPPTMRAVRDMIEAYLPDVYRYSARVDRAAAFVLGWNRLIAARAPQRCYVFYPERLDRETVREMLNHIGARGRLGDIDQALAEVSCTANAGYTVVDVEGVSDPHVAAWIRRYAEEKGVSDIATRRIKNEPDRQTPAELAAAMRPELLDQVNRFAERHGYSRQPHDCAVA